MLSQQDDTILPVPRIIRVERSDQVELRMRGVMKYLQSRDKSG